MRRMIALMTLAGLGLAAGCTAGGSHPAAPASLTPRPAGAQSGRPAGPLPKNFGTIYVTNAGSDSVTAIKPDGSTVTIPVGDDPRGIAVAPVGTPNAGTVYVADNGSTDDQADGKGTTVTAIDPTGRTRSITVGRGPWRLVVAPAGAVNAGWVYVTYRGGSPESGSVITEIKPDDTTVDLPAVRGAHELAVAPAGTRNAGTVYVSNNSTGAEGGDGLGTTTTILRPDGSRHDVRVGAGPLFVTVAPAGTPHAGTVYVANDGDRFQGSTATAIDPAGRTTTLDVGPGPDLVAIAPAGLPSSGTLYIPDGGLGNGDSMTQIDPAGGRRTITVGAGVGWAVVAPAGVPNAGSVYALRDPFDKDFQPMPGFVTIIKPDGSTKTVGTGRFPFEAVVAPSGQANAGQVYVTNFDGAKDQPGTVTMIAPDGSTSSVVTGARPNGIAIAGVG